MDGQLLVDAVGRLSQASTGDFDVNDMLRELCTAAAAVFDVDGVGVMTTDRVQHATGPKARFLDARGAPPMVQVEQLQEILAQGPCQDAFTSATTVAVADLQAEPRWARYSPAVLDLGVRAVIAVPLVARGRTWGTLDLYRHTPTVWTAAEQAAAQVLADVAVSYIVMAVDRDVASAARVELSTLALTDQLTGLPNRRLLLERMTHALAVGRRTGQVNAAVFLDVDHFKAVNDSSGHAAGDAVLIEVARRMTSILRLGDTVARLGGDEFVLFCENIAGATEGELRSSLDRITSRLRAVLQPPVALPGGVELPVKVSMGAALTTIALTATPAAATTAQDLLAIADTALYEAKTQGRDRIVISEVRPPAAGDGWQLEWDLLGALDRGKFTVHYQPIIHAATGAVHAVEALLRWDHPQHGLLPAEAFLPLALANGTLPRIGRWLIDQACGHAHHWQQATPRAPRVVFCTLSPPELTDPALPAAVTDALRDRHLRPRHLGLQITAAAFGDRPLEALLSPYQQAGHPIALGDFATSALSRLVPLGAQYARINPPLTAGLPEDPAARTVVDAALTIAHTLGLQVIAAGVDTQAQADHLTAAGCDLLQGIHLARPMTADQLTTHLSTRRPHREETPD